MYATDAGTPPVTLISGSLATRRRTVVGILGQCALAGLDLTQIRGILRLAGLPARAAADPDFPVSVDRELTALALMLRRLSASQRRPVEFALDTISAVGINHYGILGLAMQHAPSAVEALRVMLSYPELCWGHSRVVVTAGDGQVTIGFEMDAAIPTGIPTGIDAAALREYCVTTDLVSVERLIGDILGRAVTPLAVTLPFPDPGAHCHTERRLGSPVQFGAPAATIRYPAAVTEAIPVHAGELAFHRYTRVAHAFSSLLSEEADIAEQCSRLLWAHTPPPSREQLADMLGLSARTLARRLQAVGTCYAELLRRVQSERARNFLRQTSTPVAEIAERLGYSDPAAFTRAFQSWTRDTPSRWRARQRGEAS